MLLQLCAVLSLLIIFLFLSWLGIDVDIDIDHQGQRTHCGGEPNVCGGRGGRHGRRHGKGRRCNRNTWAGPEQAGANKEENAPAGEQGKGKDQGATPQTDVGKDKAAEAMVRPTEHSQIKAQTNMTYLVIVWL